MDSFESFRQELDECFENIKRQVDASFEIIDRYPDRKTEVSDLWRRYVSEFKAYTVKASESHKNRDIYKAITKALMFG